MRCKAVLLLLIAAAPARASDVKVLTSAVLYETGQAAPVLDLRSVAADGSFWRLAIEGWTLSAARERTTSKERRWFAALSATPHNAHSSERMYRGGVRDHALEFSAAALSIRGGVRFVESDRSSTEFSALAGRELLGHDAPLALREHWRTPYAGLQLTHRIRYVTAEDPLTGWIHGVAIAATAEGFGGRRAWARGTLTEEAGVPVGRVHLRQSVALMTGSGLDTVSAFLTGGSWDALRASAVYGTRYAEFRIPRGAIFNGGADLAITNTLELAVRASALRAPSLHKSGALLQVTHKTRGLRIFAGAGKSNDRTTIVAAIGGSLIR